MTPLAIDKVLIDLRLQGIDGLVENKI